MSALAMYTDPLARVVRDFKYDSAAIGWGGILGRLLVAWLESVRPPVDLIIGNPSAPTRKPYQHIELLLRDARRQDALRRWPFASDTHPVLLKQQETPRSARTGWHAKMLAAEAHAAAITVASPEQIAGRRILLVDDLFTTGAQFMTVSRLLHGVGAIAVQGLVIARTPWSTR